MTDRQSNSTIKRAGFHWGEVAGLIVLAGLTLLFLAFSWRKWPDPLIDFGTELYIPWCLATGAVLYRDVDCFYGPLSKYFNAALFAIFKPGLMVLVTANLVIFAAIVTTIYFLCRRAWGGLAAFVSSAVFVALFGFSQFVGIGNYNYATPYCHEVTHGFLICLLLALVLLRWIDNATGALSFIAGFLLGLTALLKPEILFAAGVITVFAVIQRCRSSRPSATAIGAWLIGALLPTIAFTIYFAQCFPWLQSLSLSCRGWLNAIGGSRFTADDVQIGFLGLDQPMKHLGQHLFATFVACVFVGVIAAAGWASDRVRKRWLSILSGAALAIAMFCAAKFVVNWDEVGRCLLGLVSLYLAASFFQKSPVNLVGQLVAMLAAVLMLRMILNGRIFQFGFYQAALAAVVVTATMVGELPDRLQLARKGRIIFLIGTFSLIVPGIVRLASTSVRQLQFATLPVGEDRDRFYTYQPQIEPTGELVNVISKALGKEKELNTLLVIPEGVMINYLARAPSSIAPFIYFSATTEKGGEEQIVADLDRHPPDAVVIISRNLQGYGIARYGDRIGHGKLLVRWIDDNYNQIAHLGGDPFDYRERGALIFKHR
jgi:hypothetical protein